MTTTVHPRSDPIPTPEDDPGVGPATHDSYDSQSDASYAADRRMRLRRGRLVGFAVAIPLWALSLVPLTRELLDGQAGARVVLVYLAVGAVTLGVAVAIRALYVLLMKRKFRSPWVFVLAAILAIAGYTVQSAGYDDEVPLAGPRAGGWSAEADPARSAGGALTRLRAVA